VAELHRLSRTTKKVALQRDFRNNPHVTTNPKLVIIALIQIYSLNLINKLKSPQNPPKNHDIRRFVWGLLVSKRVGAGALAYMPLFVVRETGILYLYADIGRAP
jgi:hypothetical protein